MDLDHPLHFLRRILIGMTTHDELIETYSMARLLINRGSVMDLTRPTGCRTMEFLLDTSSVVNCDVCIGIVQCIITLILRENAVKILEPSPLEIDIDFLKIDKIELIPYLYELGYKIKQVEELIPLKSTEFIDEEVTEMIQKIKVGRLWSLQRLCRKSVRKTLGAPITKKIPKLPLPRILKDYLYIDIERVSCEND